METVIPFVKKLFVSKKVKRVPDFVRADYEPFDDYLEMVIQFGVCSRWQLWLLH